MNADQIQHQMIIEGVVTPAIIHNGGYYFINLPVHENGTIDCWEMVDLALFQEKLSRGWVVTQIPDGKSISVHGLGDFTVTDGQWELTSDALYQRVLALIKRLNPEMTNLYDFHGSNTKKIGKMNTSILNSSSKTPVRSEDPENPWSRTIKGDNLSVFYRDGGELYLADLRVFADEIAEIGRIPSTKKMTMAELTQAVQDGQLLTEPPAGSRVIIHQFGSFTIGEVVWSITAEDMLLEVRDLIDASNGRPDSVKRCRSLYEDFIKKPSALLKEKLKAAYESIPEHNRMYVGDMDSKDIPVRMIIYGDQEIEGWTHRLVARAQSMEPLPNITVPKVEELSEHAKKNRDFWDEHSKSYQEAHGLQLSSVEAAWGVWQIPERELNVLGEVKDKDILEFGCGAAQWSNALALRGARVVGLDNSAQQLEHAKKIRPAGIEFPLIHASAEAVPLSDASFDIVFCDHGAMSFADPYKTVPEASRLLRGGGMLVFSMATPLLHMCLHVTTDKIEERLHADYFGLRRFESPDGAIDFQLSYGDWVRLFVRHGFIIEDLIELRPKEGATTTYKDYVPLEWARRWPAEHIWKVRKTSPSSV